MKRTVHGCLEIWNYFSCWTWTWTWIYLTRSLWSLVRYPGQHSKWISYVRTSMYYSLYHTWHAIIYMLMNACYLRKWQFYTLALSTVSILVCNYKLYINTFKCFIIYHFFKTYPASHHKISIVVKQNRNTKTFSMKYVVAIVSWYWHWG